MVIHFRFNPPSIVPLNSNRSTCTKVISSQHEYFQLNKVRKLHTLSSAETICSYHLKLRVPVVEDKVAPKVFSCRLLILDKPLDVAFTSISKLVLPIPRSTTPVSITNVPCCTVLPIISTLPSI